MKLIIAGGRDYWFRDVDFEWLTAIDDEHGITEVVSGGATGADHEGEFWAEYLGIPVKKFLADWKSNGKAAGPIRNRQMAEYADAVALFPGGKGTANMREEAKKRGLRIFERKS